MAALSFVGDRFIVSMERLLQISRMGRSTIVSFKWAMADALTKEAQRLADQFNRLTQETCNYIMGYCVCIAVESYRGERYQRSPSW
jgi:hypothetical protein